MVQTPRQDRERKVSEKEKELQERERKVRGAEIELDANRTLLNGFRDLQSWQKWLQNDMAVKKLDREVDFLRESIKFKQKQIDEESKRDKDNDLLDGMNGIVEKSQIYDGGYRLPWELGEDIKTFQLQIEEAELNKKITQKNQDIICSDRIKQKKGVK